MNVGNYGRMTFRKNVSNGAKQMGFWNSSKKASYVVTSLKNGKRIVKETKIYGSKRNKK